MSNSKISALTLATTPLAGTETLPIVQGGANRQVSVANLAGGITHNNLAGLTTGDPHTQYAFLAGRSGGQTLIGGTAASNNLTLQSTSNATRGSILFGTSAYDEVNNRLGIGLVAPATTIHARTAALTSIRAETTAATNYAQYDLVSPSRRYSMGIGGASVTDGVANDWYLYDGTAAAYRLVVDSSGRFGIGTTSPRGPLDVVASAPSVFQRDNAAVAAIHSYYNADTTTNSNGINWTFYSDTTGAGASTLQIFGQWDLRFDQHDHATRSSSALFRNYVNGASNIWLWGSSNGNVGISTSSTPSFSLSFGNAATRTISIEATGAGTAGRFLDISGGSTSAGGSNIAGGTLFLDGGLGTGSGASNIIFRTPAVAAVATDLQGTPTEAMRINNTQDVLIGANTSSAGSRLRVVKTITPTASGVANLFLGEGTVSSSSTTGIDARTFNLQLTVSGANNVTSEWGAFVNASNNLDTGRTISNHYAYGASPRITGAGASANMGGFYAEPLFNSTATGAVTSYYGFRSVSWNRDVAATSTVTNAYGLFLNALAASYVTNAWGVYQAGASDTNYFNASVGIGTTSVTDKLTVNGAVRAYGAYNESTTNPGVYLGAPASDNPRVMFADGSGSNWQIDVTTGIFRWYIPGYNMMRLNKAAGSNAGIISLWQENVLYWTVEPSYMFWGNGADVDIMFNAATAAGTAGKALRLWANDTTAGGSNIAGGAVSINAGLGTGTGASDIVFRTGTSTGTATALQGYTTRLTIGNNGNFTFADTANFVVGTTVGLKIGTATTQKIGFYNATPIVRPSAYTQTYSTADKTMAARTAAALTDNTGGTVSTTLAAITAGATYSQTDMTNVKNALASLADQVNKSRNDSLDIAQVVNAVIDDLQALGLVG